jgi:hypothetical protein
MPEICRFFGIVIRMYFGDHPPPHFHVEYGEHRAVVDIHTLMVIGGASSASSVGFNGGMGFTAPGGAIRAVGAGCELPASV